MADDSLRYREPLHKILDNVFFIINFNLMKAFIIKNKKTDEENKKFSIIAQNDRDHIEVDVSISVTLTTDIEEVWGREVIREEEVLIPEIEVVDASHYADKQSETLILWVKKNINEIYDFLVYNQDKKEIDGIYCRLGKKLY